MMKAPVSTNPSCAWLARLYLRDPSTAGDSSVMAEAHDDGRLWGDGEAGGLERQNLKIGAVARSLYSKLAKGLG